MYPMLLFCPGRGARLLHEPDQLDSVSVLTCTFSESATLAFTVKATSAVSFGGSGGKSHEGEFPETESGANGYVRLPGLNQFMSLNREILNAVVGVSFWLSMKKWYVVRFLVPMVYDEEKSGWGRLTSCVPWACKSETIIRRMSAAIGALCPPFFPF